MGYARRKPTGINHFIENNSRLEPTSIVPSRGPAIRGDQRIDEVVSQHLSFLEECQDNDGLVPRSWPRPARTAYFLTSEPPWPQKEVEDLGDGE